MKQRTRWFAGFAAAALLLTTAAGALAYTGQVLASITVAPRGDVTCSAPLTIVATILDGEGQPVAGESVAWSWARSLSSDDRITATPTTTNADGIATTTVVLGNVSGNRQIRATAGDVQASAVLGAACGGLPLTSTAPAGPGGSSLPFGALLVMAVLGLAGLGLLTRTRLAATRS